MTGQKATSTCPYAYEGTATAEGFCPHSLINGVSAQDYMTLLQMQQAGLVNPDGTPVDPNAAAAAQAAAAQAAAAQQQQMLDALNAAAAAQAALGTGQ